MPDHHFIISWVLSLTPPCSLPDWIFPAANIQFDNFLTRNTEFYTIPRKSIKLCLYTRYICLSSSLHCVATSPSWWWWSQILAHPSVYLCIQFLWFSLHQLDVSSQPRLSTTNLNPFRLSTSPTGPIYTDNDTKLLYCVMLRLRISAQGPRTRSNLESGQRRCGIIYHAKIG